jgi:hypothetical protein
MEAMSMTDKKARPPDPEQLKKLLVVREHARADAWLRKDKKALEALLAPDYRETSDLGSFSRTEVLDHLLSSLILHSFTIEEPSIRITGENTAVISYRCTEAFTIDGKHIEGVFRVFATYTREKNQYRLSIWDIRPVN